MAFFSKLFPRDDRPPRTLELAGGAASIRIPARYSDQRESDATLLLTLADKTPVWLRVSTLLVKFEKDASPEELQGFLDRRADEHHATIEDLFDGKRLFTYDENRAEDAQPLIIRYWEIAFENSLTIISLTTFPDKLATPPLQAVLADIPPMIDSLELAEQTEFVETPAGAIETRVGRSAKPAPDVRHPFTPAQQAELAEYLTAATRLLARYAGDSALPLDDHDPRTLDLAFARWAADEDPDKPPDELIAKALGCAFGQFLADHLALRWITLTDSAGTSWAIEHPTSVTAFPIESVRKRIANHETEFFHNIALILKAQIDKDPAG